jgi:hypothetical protein
LCIELWSVINFHLEYRTQLIRYNTNRHLVANQKELGEEMTNLAFEISLFILRSDVLHAVKSYDMGPTALLLFRRKAGCGFLSPLKSIAPVGFEPTNLGYNDKHANYYTTKVTYRYDST